MKKICAITMVRDDEFFLRKWVEYYGSQLGLENIYVFFDGKDQTVPEFCRGANTMLCERVAGNVKRADKGRIDFLSGQAAALLQRYDLVIGTDVDEFLIVDPALGMSLPQYLDSLNVRNAVSALGVDVGQHLDKEDAIDSSRPFLQQRHYGLLSSRYTKSSVIARPLNWGSGFHRVRGHNYHIDPNLYLFHFGCIDLNRLKTRSNEAERQENGWAHHLKKRARTISVVTDSRAHDWDADTVRRVRKLQQIARPIFAWNKPTVFGLKFVVKIPTRFSEIL